MRKLIFVLLVALGMGFTSTSFAEVVSSPPVVTANTAQIDLNHASADELAHLSGLGAVKSKAIIAYREQHGPFTSVDQLLEVKGIGPATLTKLRPSLTVSTN